MFFGENTGNRSPSVYHPVLQDDAETKVPDLERDANIDRPRLTFVVGRNLGWIFFVVACILHLAHWYFLWQTPETSCHDDNVLHAPLVWEERTYLSNIYGQDYDIYSQENPDVENAWRSILFPGLTRISADEMAHLPGDQKTAEARDGEGYVVVLEAFHQLHCLNSIRKAFYNQGKRSNLRDGLIGSEHVDHCFSYLVQSLLCHVDVGSTTIRWNDQEDVYEGNFNVTRTCRNYDVVRDWAAKRKPEE